MNMTVDKSAFGYTVADITRLFRRVFDRRAAHLEALGNPTRLKIYRALIRAGGLRDRATYFRNDLALAGVPGYTVKNPHTFLTNLAGAGAPFALAGQQQIATFFASDGTTTIDPDGAGPIFETPTSMVPEDLAYIP